MGGERGGERGQRCCRLCWRSSRGPPVTCARPRAPSRLIHHLDRAAGRILNSSKAPGAAPAWRDERGGWIRARGVKEGHKRLYAGTGRALSIYGPIAAPLGASQSSLDSPLGAGQGYSTHYTGGEARPRETRAGLHCQPEAEILAQGDIPVKARFQSACRK